jgi:hypothetical protein
LQRGPACSTLYCVLLHAGANSGIGVETVRALAHAGADCILCSRSVEAGERVAAQLQPGVKVCGRCQAGSPTPGCQAPCAVGSMHLPCCKAIEAGAFSCSFLETVYLAVRFHGT